MNRLILKLFGAVEMRFRFSNLKIFLKESVTKYIFERGGFSMHIALKESGKVFRVSER